MKDHKNDSTEVLARFGRDRRPRTAAHAAERVERRPRLQLPIRSRSPVPGELRTIPISRATTVPRSTRSPAALPAARGLSAAAARRPRPTSPGSGPKAGQGPHTTGSPTASLSASAVPSVSAQSPGPRAGSRSSATKPMVSSGPKSPGSARISPVSVSRTTSRGVIPSTTPPSRRARCV